MTGHWLSRRTAATTRFSSKAIGCQKQTAPRYCQHLIRWAFTSQAFTRWRHLSTHLIYNKHCGINSESLAIICCATTTTATTIFSFYLNDLLHQTYSRLSESLSLSETCHWGLLQQDISQVRQFFCLTKLWTSTKCFKNGKP